MAGAGLNRMMPVDPLFTDLEQLGLSIATYERLCSALTRRCGALLLVGPRDSGRTTTLYACVRYLDRLKARIMTVEGEIVEPLAGVVQVKVSGLTDAAYSTATRYAIGRSPDVLAVSELGGPQVAQTALEAAAMGPLVLGNLRAKGAGEALSMLASLGVDPFLIKSAVYGVLAQRRVRALCRHCREPYHPDAMTLQRLRLAPALKATESIRFYRATGCPACDQTGYSGACVLFEWLPSGYAFDEILFGAAPVRLAPSDETTWWDDGIEKCARGLTSPDELLAQAV